MRPHAAILFVLVAGCATTSDFSEASFVHSYDEGAPRAFTFDLPAGVDRVRIHIEITGRSDPLQCTVTEAPVRAGILDPTAREVVAVEVTGEPIASGGNACTATNAPQEFAARAGTWTASFSGGGDLTASVNVAPLE